MNINGLVINCTCHKFRFIQFIIKYFMHTNAPKATASLKHNAYTCESKHAEYCKEFRSSSK